MHWIQTIRENLELSQEELARYLRLSLHMIKSVELGRRQLPFESMRAALTFYNAMKNPQAHTYFNDPSPEDAPCGQRMRKDLYRRCCRRLELCADKLKKMQKAYESGLQSLGVYQCLAQETPVHNEDDRARVQWAQQKIDETIQRIKDNNLTAQDLLTAEITGLRSMKQAIEAIPV